MTPKAISAPAGDTFEWPKSNSVAHPDPHDDLLIPVGDGSPETLAYALSESGLTRLDRFEDGGVTRQYELDQTVGLESMDTHTPNARALD